MGKLSELRELKKVCLQQMFPQEGEDMPRLRFAGFTGVWEQRKLGDLIESQIIVEQSDGNHGELYPRSDEFQEQGVPYISASNISSDGNSIDFRSVKYLSPERGNKFRKGVAKNGDVLLAHNATVGPSLRLEMPFDYAILSTTLTLFRLDDAKMDSRLFLSLIRSRGFQSQLERLMKQTTRNQVPILTQRLIDVMYPLNITEQTKIGTFFRTLDNTIAIYKHKLDSLRELKKACLQQMFPQEGEDMPRLRFAGFTGAWEQCRLGDVAETFEYGLNAAAADFDGTNKYIRITDIDDESREFKADNVTSPDCDINASDNYKLQDGDILFARTGASVGKTYRYLIKDGLVYFAGFLIRARLKNNFDTDFVYQNTLTKKYSDFIKIMSQRSGQPGVNAQEYAGFPLDVPCLEEQQKIGNFFRTIDQLIKLYS